MTVRDAVHGAKSRYGRRRASASPRSGGGEPLLGIGAAAARAGVSARALRYYQQLGLITPAASTPGGMRRYSEADLARVERIRQLQTLLGLNLEEIAIVLRNEDRMTAIRDVYHAENTTDADRRGLVAESLRLQQELRSTVQGKRDAIDTFLTDLDERIARTRDFMERIVASASTVRED
jgi:MerR family transcriptional regulator, repressor of the yfmOP operon